MGKRNSEKPECRRTVRFVLDGRVVELDDAGPDRTVLQYLREDLGRTGTKEGCAEGDCGACTVVVADLDASGNKLRVRAVNSCIQFLPTLDGKALLTVESLVGADGVLHPAQRAMVDCHGSQCGFCTPGFVMSLFALFKNNENPARREIDVALAGNLCRCTGYGPIVDAATAMYSCTVEPGKWLTQAGMLNAAEDAEELITQLRTIESDEPLCVEKDEHRFFAPVTIEHLADLVAQFPSATILAGGTDAGLWVTKQYQVLGDVIYTGKVAGLADIEVRDGSIQIGAAASMTDVMACVIEHYPALEELFVRFASPPIRNAATLGGNIANGSPIGDSMPALMVLDTVLVLRAGAKSRSIALSDFYIGYQQTALQPGEFLQQVRIPLPVDGDRVQSYKVSKRFDQDISAVCGAYRLSLDGDKVAGIRIAYGGMAAVPSRATHCEQALLGNDWAPESIERAMDGLDDDFEPLSDMRSSAEYRRQVCRNLLKRFYLETADADPGRVYTYGR